MAGRKNPTGNRRDPMKRLTTMIYNDTLRGILSRAKRDKKKAAKEERERLKEEKKLEKLLRAGATRALAGAQVTPELQHEVEDWDQGLDFIPVEDLISCGDIQELNRTFFHPQGKELLVLTRSDGTKYLGGVIDCGDDVIAASFPGGVNKKKADSVARAVAKQYSARFKMFGNPVQPITARRK